MPRKVRRQTGGSAGSLPSIEIRGANGSHTLVATFTSSTQTLNADPGSMVYTRGNISQAALKVADIGTSFARAFSGQSMFLTTYTGPNATPSAPGMLALSMDTPADIIEIRIREGQKFRINRGSFLASSSNVELKATFQLKAVIPIGQEEGAVMPILEVPPGAGDGVAWLSSFGLSEIHNVGPGEVMTVDNGVFLAVDGNTDYEIVRLGTSLLSSLLSSEGFGMKFTGPCLLYTQSKNFHDFCHTVADTAGVTAQSGGSNLPKPRKSTTKKLK